MGYGVAYELMTNGLLNTPRLKSSDGTQYYQFAESAIAATRTITYPLLTANANVVFDSFLNVFSVLQTISAGGLNVAGGIGNGVAPTANQLTAWQVLSGAAQATSLTIAGQVTGGAPLQRDVIFQTGNAANPQVLVTRLTLNSNAAAVTAAWANVSAMSFDQATTVSTGAGVLTLAPASGSNLAFTVAGVGNIAFTLGTGTVTGVIVGTGWNLNAQTISGAGTFSGTLTLSSAGTALSVTNNATISGTATVGVLAATTINGAVLSGTFTGTPIFSGTVAFTAASPFSIANAQTLTISTTAQTIGAATLTVPNFAGVADTFAFITLTQTIANKTLGAGWNLGGQTIAGAGTFSGALTFTALLTLNAGLTVTGAAVNLNASSNFATNINTGTSSGAVTIGNAAAGIITIANRSNTAATFLITDGTNNYVAVDTRTTVSINAITLGLAAPTIVSAAGTTFVKIQDSAYTLTLTGGIAVTSLAGLKMVVGSPTVTSASLTTVTTASSVSLSGPLPAVSVTFTNSIALDIPTYATNGTTASGVRIAAPTGAATNWAMNVTSGNINVAGTGTYGGLLTSVGLTAGAGLIQGTLGITISGAAVSLNASSNFDTNINTGTSTGAINIGNAASGNITLVTNGNLALTATASNINITGFTVNGMLVGTGWNLNAQTIAGAGTFSGALTTNALFTVTAGGINVAGGIANGAAPTANQLTLWQVLSGAALASSLIIAGQVTGGAPLQRDLVFQTGNAANPQVLVTRLTLNSNAAAVTAAWANVNAMSFDQATTVSTGAGALTIAPASGSNLALTVAGAGNIAITLGTGAVTIGSNGVVLAAAGVIAFNTTAAALTIGSLGSIIAPYDTLTTETDLKAGNLNGAIAVNNADLKIYARTGGLWKGVAIAGFSIPKSGTIAPILNRPGFYHGDEDNFNETLCPLCKQMMMPLDAMALVGDRNYSDGGLHAYTAHMKCLLLEELKRNPGFRDTITAILQ